MASEMRTLSKAEIAQLQKQECSSSDWTSIKVAQNFNSERVEYLYANNQVKHHKIETFIDEYKRLLKEFKIEFDEKYLL